MQDVPLVEDPEPPMNAQIKPKAKPARPSEIKQQAKELIDRLPARGLTWDRLAYHMTVRADIEAGLADSAAGRTYTTAQVRKMFGLR
jgi:hypothetical protein